eukprot:4380662-Amphidinium_carterae.1
MCGIDPCLNLARVTTCKAPVCSHCESNSLCTGDHNTIKPVCFTRRPGGSNTRRTFSANTSEALIQDC